MNKMIVIRVMDRFKSSLKIALFCFILISIHCASKSGEWKGKLLFSNKQLQSTSRTTGRTVIILPLIVDNSFDTSQSVSPEKFTKALIREQETVKLLFKKDYEEKIILKHSRGLLDSFYVTLIKNDILALNGLDTVWKSLPGQYLLTIRINTGVRINSFDDIVKRKAELEAEMWDIKRIEIVWRGQSSGYEMNAKVSDAEFIMHGIRNVFSLLPDFIPIREEDNW